jgi:uncharacterized glyoxalase superfamily protein PhnB
MKFALLTSSVIAFSFRCRMAFESARARTATLRPGVTGIGGIFFKSRGPQKLAACYRDLLGTETASETGSGAQRLRMARERQPERARRDSTVRLPAKHEIFRVGPQPFMIDYRVDNLDGVLAQLRAAGATFESKIEDETNGRFGWATDPEGNRFELWQPKP